MPAPPQKPAHAPKGSVVFIVLDTTRADALDPYRQNAHDTPFFDQMADEGTLYEEMVSASPWNLPCATGGTRNMPRLTAPAAC